MIERSLLKRFKDELAGVRGSVVEIGVWKGETALELCKAFPGDRVHLFDTFSGMPDLAIPIDSHKAGDFHDTSVAEVERRLHGRSFQIHEGIFPESAADWNGEKIKFCHVDVDLYRSTLDAYSWAWDRMEAGGVILDDDYAHCRCAGARQAVDEFCESVNIKPQTYGCKAWVTKTNTNGRQL